MPVLKILREKREHILHLARQHGASNVRIFGSAARGKLQMGSDLDILIDLHPGRSLLDHVALKQDLEDLLGYPIDLVTEKSLHPHIRDHVLEEAVLL